MAFLIRKIDMPCWEIMEQASPVNADAITRCLRTKDNTLSVWRVEAKELITDGLLAIASSQDHLRKIDIVVLDEQSLIDGDISIANVPGNSPCEELNDLHRDLAELTVHSLDVISSVVANEIRNKENLHSYTIASLKALLESAVNSGRIEPGSLKPDVRKKLSFEAAP